MIAEIFHKSVDKDSEDQLTGNVFGALRYLPYSAARQIIINSVLPADVSKILEKSLPQEIAGEWGSNIYFWRHYDNTKTEPDVVIELGQAVILIEVKYNSELSGDDQLVREAELLKRNYPYKEKILLLLAREESAVAIYKENEPDIPKDVSLGYITWQRLYDTIFENNTGSLIFEDMINLLNEKGFSGFRGFDMMNEETIKAFQTVRKVHKNVKEFISHCITLADEKGEFELAPMTGNNTFLRWSSDRDLSGWAYCSFFIIFQRCCDSKLKNGYRNGPLYILELNFIDFDIPMANVARYDYEDMNNWLSSPLSPSEHSIFYDPMYNGMIEFPEYEPAKMYSGQTDEPLDRYWGLKRIIGYEIPLSEIFADNAYEKIFGTFKELSGVDRRDKQD